MFSEIKIISNRIPKALQWLLLEWTLADDFQDSHKNWWKLLHTKYVPTWCALIPFYLIKMSVTIYMCIHLVIAIRINSLQFKPSLLEKGLSRSTQIKWLLATGFLTRLQDNVFVSTFRLIPVSFWTVLISC